MTTSQYATRNRLRNDAGFTLVEVLLAMAIFSIGILALAALQTTYISYNASSRMQTEAAVVATQWLERLKVLPDDHADLDPVNNPHERTDGVYQVTWNVTDNSPINDVKTISINVAALNRNARSVTFNYRRQID